MGWDRDPVVALEELAGSGSEPLTGRPHVLCAPGLRACVGSVAESVAGEYGSAARQDFEMEVQNCLLSACSPHLHSLAPAGGGRMIGSQTSAFSLRFKDDTASCEKRQGLADRGYITLETSKGELHVLVRSEPCRVPTDCAQISLHGLPAEFNVHGVISTVLSCAGYGREALVKAEFAGELPAALAAAHPDVVRSDVAMAVVKLPQGDPGLCRLPRRFYDHGNDASFWISVASHTGAKCRLPTSDSGRTSGEESARPPRQHRRRTAHRGAKVPDSAAAPSSVRFVPAKGRQPLHPIDDLGGQFDRRGIGRPRHPPGFPPGARFPIPGNPATVSASPPPSGPAQPPLPVGMQRSVPDSHERDPLTEACMLFLEDRAPDLPSRDRRTVVAEVASECPAAWAEFRHSQVLPPAGAFRDMLRDVVRRMFPAASVDDNDCLGQDGAQATLSQRGQNGRSPVRGERQPGCQAHEPHAHSSGQPRESPADTRHPPNANPYQAGPGPPAGRGRR